MLSLIVLYLNTNEGKAFGKGEPGNGDPCDSFLAATLGVLGRDF